MTMGAGVESPADRLIEHFESRYASLATVTVGGKPLTQAVVGMRSFIDCPDRHVRPVRALRWVEYPSGREAFGCVTHRPEWAKDSAQS